MLKRHRWFWILVFIATAVLLFGLAAGWNVLLIHDYQSIVQLAKSFSKPPEFNIPPIILRIIWGTLGFILVITLSVLIFIKLLREMRLNQQQSEFLATISHEFKTPLAALELTSGLLQSEGISPDQVQHLWKAHQTELNRLQEEVRSLLEAARWQVHKPALHKEMFLLEDWIQQSWKHWQTLLGPKVMLFRDGEPLPILIRSDRATLHLIMNNLLSNAKKFSQERPRVLLRTQLIHSMKKIHWQIQVQDQGWGFAPQDAKKIFQRFFRSSHPAPYAIPGTGLGLYLARSASHVLKLSLEASSPGFQQGACFTLRGCVSKKHQK